MLQGFDVSHWQGSTDWASMKSRYGADFGFAKATEHEGFVDSRFAENWRKMRAAGIIRGAYHFARPDTNPLDDARKFVAVVKAADSMLPTDLLVLDLEVSDLGQDATSLWARGWAMEVRRLLPGYLPGVYMGAGYLTNRTGEGLRGPFGWLWYPRWPSKYAGQSVWPTTFTPVLVDPKEGKSIAWSDSAWGGPPLFWQFSDSFPVNGEPHDANVYSGTLSTLRSLNNTSTGGGGTLPGKEEQMSWTEQLPDRIIGGTNEAGELLSFARADAYKAWQQTIQNKQEIGALRSIVAAHIAADEQNPLTAEQIIAAAKTGAEMALAEGVDLRVTVNDQES